jgi:hypothetical protein
MNKETRSFIFGMFVLIVCGTGCAIHLTNISNGANYNLYNWILFALCVLGVYSGAVRVFNNID